MSAVVALRPAKRSGNSSVAEHARRMIEAGHGLSEAEIERFYARVDAARSNKRDGGAVAKFRALIENYRVVTRSLK